jgi:hypothetical protein
MLKTLQPTVPAGCISDLTFDAWRAGEVTPEVTEGLKQHLALCERCQRRHESIERQAVEFWSQAPAPIFQSRASTKIARRRWLVPSALAVSALAAALVVYLAPREETRTKGLAHVSFHVQHEGTVTVGTDGQKVFPGDRLRFSITTGKPAHVAVLSLDGAGVASVYFPQGTTSRSYGMVNGLALDSSVLLDNTLGTESLWALFCDKEFALEPLRADLERAGRLPVPAGCTLDHHTFVKRAAP